MKVCSWSRAWLPTWYDSNMKSRHQSCSWTSTRAVARAWAAYREGDEHPWDANRPFALKHEVLPVLIGWTGFLGLRKDGRLHWVDCEKDVIVDDPVTVYDCFLASIEAARRYPDLADAAPKHAEDWIRCDVCGGSGQVSVGGQTLENVVCQCGGLGAIPPDVFAFLAARGQTQRR